MAVGWTGAENTTVSIGGTYIHFFGVACAKIDVDYRVHQNAGAGLCLYLEAWKQYQKPLFHPSSLSY